MAPSTESASNLKRITPLLVLRSNSKATPKNRLNSADCIAAPPVYFYTVSRPLELSLQSSLQLSLTVLVRYRSRGHI